MGKPTGWGHNYRKMALARRYRLTKRQQMLLTTPFIMQLFLCKGEAARRLLLGVSR